MIFIGLLAFDWLRVLIWFDHMGLRVATLVNLTFVGGDRADEAAARFVGHDARTPRHPRWHAPLRHLGAAADPVLHSARPEWDKAWTGAETLRNAADRCRARCGRWRSPTGSPASRWRWAR